MNTKSLKNIDIDKIAKAIEVDAGQPLLGLRESLAQAKRGEFAAIHTPEVETTIRLSPDVMAAFKATGAGWQTRIDAALKEWLQTHSLA
jgi:uncharacterized protein (DUF4415 family)